MPTQCFIGNQRFQYIILLSLFFRKMSQMLTKHSLPTRQSSGSTIVSINPEEILLNTRAETKKFSMSQIIIQVMRILSNESTVCQQDLQIISSSKNLSDALLFLRYSPFKQNSRTPNKQTVLRAKIGCKCEQQVTQLKKSLENKNLIIMKLNQGYQQSKQIHKQELIHKQKHINSLKKQICQLKNQNQLLSQKVANFKNFKPSPIQQKKNTISTSSVIINRVQAEEIKKQTQKKIDHKHRSNSNESRRSSYQQLKDLLQVMSNKIQGLQQIDQTFDRKQRAQKLQNQSFSNLGSSARKIAQIYGTPTASKSNLRKKYSSSRNQKFDGSDQLVQQVAVLRQNQSKLLDKICERDEIISQLMKMNEKGQKSRVSYSTIH